MQHKGRYVTLMTMESDEPKALAPTQNRPLATLDRTMPFGRAIVVPKLVADVGDRAAKRFANFFGSIANDNTRAAYQRACHCFFAWCDEQRARRTGRDRADPCRRLPQERWRGTFEKPTIKQHLAAIRMLFDWLVVGQVIAINPAHAVRGAEARHQARQDAGADARRGAPAARQHRRDNAGRPARPCAHRPHDLQLRARRRGRRHARRRLLRRRGKRWWVRLHEKGGKRHEMPCHHNLEAYLDAYLHAANLVEAKKTPLFRSARGRTGELHRNSGCTGSTLPHDPPAGQGRRPRADVCCHMFRATGHHGLSGERRHTRKRPAMAAHESPRTTKLYDRTGDEITLDEVERIMI